MFHKKNDFVDQNLNSVLYYLYSLAYVLHGFPNVGISWPKCDTIENDGSWYGGIS